MSEWAANVRACFPGNPLLAAGVLFCYLCALYFLYEATIGMWLRGWRHWIARELPPDPASNPPVCIQPGQPGFVVRPIALGDGTWVVPIAGKDWKVVGYETCPAPQEAAPPVIRKAPPPLPQS